MYVLIVIIYQPVVDETTKKFKSFNKSLRGARSFRAARQKIDKKAFLLNMDGFYHKCQTPEPPPNIHSQEVAFLISPSLSGRIG